MKKATKEYRNMAHPTNSDVMINPLEGKLHTIISPNLKSRSLTTLQFPLILLLSNQKNMLFRKLKKLNTKAAQYHFSVVLL